jgi:hypothetical protein
MPIKFHFFMTVGFAWLSHGVAIAGMPAPLPTNWTKDHNPGWATSSESWTPASIDAQLQAISFFLAILLVCALIVMWLWKILRRDITWLPPLDYQRAASLTILWGLLFIVVLTMISGARELMTPGAWRKQGWTYRLAESLPAAASAEDSLLARRQGLEQLKVALLTYAATHQGQFPSSAESSIEASLWEIAGWPGVQFQLIPDRDANAAAQLLVFEPEVEGDERLVLMTNGLIGTMRSSEITQALLERSEP